MRPKISALGEVFLVFGLSWASFAIWQLGQLTVWKEAVFTDAPLFEYLTLLILVPLYLRLTGRPLVDFGLAMDNWQRQLRLTGRAFIGPFLLGAALSWLPWQTWPGSLLVTGLALGLAGLTAYLLRRPPAVPLLQASLLPLVWLAVLGLAAVQAGSGGWWRLPYFYLLVAPAEEMLFRGFIQTRLNQVWRRPFSLFGIRWGWGLLGGALLFGLWHVVNPLRPWVWPHALWTAAAGLLFGLIRERAGQVGPPALLHGVMNYGPQALLADLFRLGG